MPPSAENQKGTSAVVAAKRLRMTEAEKKAAQIRRMATEGRIQITAALSAVATKNLLAMAEREGINRTEAMNRALEGYFAAHPQTGSSTP